MKTRLWNNLQLDQKEIDKIVKKHSRLTGRDIKNLLKLASFVSESQSKKLSLETIEYAMQFKPTENFFK